MSIGQTLRSRTAGGAQSGFGALGVLLGLVLTAVGWHAAHSNYTNGYLLADPTKDADLHSFGWLTLPVGLALLATSLALTVSGFRRARPRYVLWLTAGLALVGIFAVTYAAVTYEDLSSVCACTGG